MSPVTGATSFRELYECAKNANSSYNIGEYNSNNVVTKKMVLSSLFGIKTGYLLITVSSPLLTTNYYYIAQKCNVFYLFNLNPSVSGYRLVNFTYSSPISKKDYSGVTIPPPESGPTTLELNDSIDISEMSSLSLVANFVSES